MAILLFQRGLASALGDSPEFHEDRDALEVDLKVTATAELERVVGVLTRQIEARKQRCDPSTLRLQLQHIEEALDDAAVPFSIDHLELYRNFLSRVQPPAELEERQAALSGRVDGMLRTHPLACEARSGDRADSPKHHLRGDEVSVVRVPGRRRLQMCAALWLDLFFGPPACVLLAFLLWYFVPLCNYLVPIYLVYIVFDNLTGSMPRPGRFAPSWRSMSVWEHGRDYFPIRYVRSRRDADYDPEKNFLFAYHPHGVIAVGAQIVSTAASGVDKLFPGLHIAVQTLKVMFWLPFFREHAFALGGGDASRSTLLRALKGPGRSALLVTGGARESMYSHPYHAAVVLKERFGFVKIALMAGARLVPVWGFGENNLYENLAATEKVRGWQRRIQRMLSFAPVLVAGRGIFTYGGGLLPHRRPITVVFGEPIEVDQTAEPTREQIQAVHGKYLAALRRMFLLYRDIYDPKARDIEFV